MASLRQTPDTTPPSRKSFVGYPLETDPRPWVSKHTFEPFTYGEHSYLKKSKINFKKPQNHCNDQRRRYFKNLTFFKPTRLLLFW